MESQNISIVIAFAAGLLSFVSPCILPLVPAYLGNLAGSSVSPEGNPSARRVTFLHALSFVVGFSLIFIGLGASIGLLGSLIFNYLGLFRQIAGVLLIFLGLHLIGVFKIPFLYYERRLDYNPSAKPGYLRSFLVGSAFSLGWTPCVGPILGGIFVLAWSSQTLLQGVYLLFAYSLGLGIPFLMAGLALGSVTNQLRRLNRYVRVVSVVSGILLIGVGALIFTDSLALLNQYFDFFGLGAGI